MNAEPSAELAPVGLIISCEFESPRFSRLPKLLNSRVLLLPRVQRQLKILVGGVVLIFTVYSIVKISLLVVKKAIHIEVVVLESVLTRALIENLSGFWRAK